MNKDNILTPKQKKAYLTIKSHINSYGESPTLSELAKQLKVSSIRSVTQYLESLQRKGLIIRSRYAQRSIKLTEDSKPSEEIIQVPVFASAGCGSPNIIAERSFDEFVSLSKDFLDNKKDNLFIIKAVGESMLDAGIKSGDMVLVEKTEDVQSGDLICAIIEDTAVIKKLSFANNAVILSPVSHDPSYHPIILKRDFKVFGKVIQTIKIERSTKTEIIPIKDNTQYDE